MEKEEHKEKSNRKTRVCFSKQIKRLALIELSKGKNAKQIFNALGIELSSNDKKYAAKLIHKWRKEFFDNSKLYPISDRGFDEKLLRYELEHFMQCDK